MSYTIKNLRDADDMAAKHGFGELQEARFPWRDLGATATGLALIHVRPGRRQPFAHRHRDAEEIYVVLSGSGRLKLDEEVVEVREMDAVRIEPSVVRAAEAGPDGLELLAFGPRHEGDAEVLEADFWDD
jgi:mannose-6-phosphate isomerase-like protein (cupin superfamily)